MAPKKKAYSKLSKSAKYYRDNPKARKKKASTDKKVNKRPEQKKKRSELSTARKKMKRKIWAKAMKWKDLAHTKNWLRLKDSSKNRWSKSDAPWDKRARGGKKKKRKSTKKK